MKYTVEEVAMLLVKRTHAIHNDNNEFELLRGVLKKAFPKDDMTDVYDFYGEDEGNVYGWARYDSGEWANIGEYLKELVPIKLSEVISNISEKKTEVETVTISKEDYDRFKELESEQMSECSLRDYFAAKVVNGLCAGESEWVTDTSHLVSTSYRIADEMLKQRKQ